MLSPGTILQDRYKIIRSLAAGGMGTVYEALDQRLNAIVAVKERVVEGDHTRDAFLREASLLANLNHQALPIVTDHFFDEERQCLVMRYVPGDDLAQSLKKRGNPFPLSDVLNWTHQLLDALEYLHNNNPPIVHRDIKPANIKLSAQGRVILLDFGLAKGATGQMATLTGGRSVLGFTRDYAPMEQMHGEETDPRSDLYSLGATLYHLMTGLVPVDASKRYCETDAGRADPLAVPSTINPEISSELSKVLLRAMSLKRGDRISTAFEMRNLLKKSDVTGSSEEITIVQDSDRNRRGAPGLPLHPPDNTSPKQLKFEYWTKLNEILRKKNSVVRLNPIKANFQVTGFIGHPQIQLFSTISLEQNRLTVGLRILNRKDIYRALVRDRKAIEAEIDGDHSDDFRWRERKSVQTVSEITLTRQPDNIRWRDRWPEYLAWHRDRLESFYAVFDPRVRKFKTTTRPNISKVATTSPREQLVRQFWDDFESVASRESSLIQLNKPYIPPGGGGKSWRNKSLGSGFNLAVQLNASKNYVDVNITVRPANYRPFVKIHSKRKDIERELGIAVEWRINEAGESWVITKRPFQFSDVGTWEQTFDWLCETLGTFQRVFAHRVTDSK